MNLSAGAEQWYRLGCKYFIDLTLQEGKDCFGEEDGRYFSNGGIEIRQLFQDYPVLQPLYPFHWENNFNALDYLVFAKNHIEYAYLACGIYALAVFLGPRLMKQCAPMKAKWCVAHSSTVSRPSSSTKASEE